MILRAVGLALALLTALIPALSAGQESAPATLRLAATLGGSTAQLTGGIRWRIFAARAEPDGSHVEVSESNEARPVFSLPPGDYVVHVAFGLASATKSDSLGNGEDRSDTLAIAAGALRIGATRDSARLDPNNVWLAIYVPERNNAEANLVYSKARLGEVIGVPEGAYHIVSTYLDTVGVGTLGLGKAAGNAGATATLTNSVATGDVRVAAGKIVDVTLRHRFATVTIKLVKTPGGEALANSTFIVLTPGGDVIRELIGAFPSLVLAEGEYVAIARHNSKTYQSTFEVKSGLDRDVEIIAKEADTSGP